MAAVLESAAAYSAPFKCFSYGPVIEIKALDLKRQLLAFQA